MAKTKRMQRTLRRAGAPNIGYYTWSSGKKIRKFAKCYMHLNKVLDYYFDNNLEVPTWTINESIKVQRKALTYYLMAYPQIPKSVQMNINRWDQSLFDDIEATHQITEQIRGAILEIARNGENSANQI